jgi:2-polyprenyl-6-methoxyphenol hydroxylase-like FAD-dependent oxidoreductase
MENTDVQRVRNERAGPRADESTTDTEHVDCIIAGGGPAGIVAGLLLARGGVRVVVLEKHEDFFRDFRGDTIHPSTLRLLDELGLYHEFARITHRRITGVSLVGRKGEDIVLADLSRLRVPHPFVTIAPQWDFLNLLARAGEKEPCFDLRMGVEMTSLVRDGDRVVGVRAQSSRADSPHGDLEFRAPLVIAADGRWSKAREQVGLPVRELHSGIDVWWFRVNTTAHVTEEIAPRAVHGSVFVAIPRDGYVQIARLIPKGEDARFRARGIAELRRSVAETYPALVEDVDAIELDDVKLLDVRRNEAIRWYVPGLLCIGDSAHAMSPLGGVGVNLAVQDGVATARLLAESLRTGEVSTAQLRRVQRQRMLTTKAVQLIQAGIHRMVEPVVHRGGPLHPPAPLEWLATRIPALTVIPARILGMGITPEHAPDLARRPEGSQSDLSDQRQ